MILFSTASNQTLASVSNFTPPTPAGTISIWLNFTSIATGAIFYTGSSWYLRMINNDLKTYFLRSGAKPTTVVNPFVAGTTYHVAVSYEDTGAKTTNTVYINGALVISEEQNDGAQGATTLYVAGTATGQFNGSLEDFRVYDRILSANEIETIYSCRGIDGIRTNLLNRWPMDMGAEGTVATGAGSVKDLTGNIDMTPVNSPIYLGSSLKKRRVA